MPSGPIVENGDRPGRFPTSDHEVDSTAMMRIGLLGCGNIAEIIASRGEAVTKIVACHDRHPERTERYAALTGATPYTDIGAFLDADYPLLVEAASVTAVHEYLLPALSRAKDVLVLSVGAFLVPSFFDDAREAASTNRRRIHIPSGAVFGLDNIKVARISRLQRLLLRSTKPPRALGMSDCPVRTCVFRGSAGEAVRRYPRNINVSASLALAAGIEPEVEIWADPAASSNRHEIEAQGEFGRVAITTDNVPSPDNPATSYLAALSVLTLLKDLADPVTVGT